jgi:hypothetical protein
VRMAASGRDVSGGNSGSGGADVLRKRVVAHKENVNVRATLSSGVAIGAQGVRRHVQSLRLPG